MKYTDEQQRRAFAAGRVANVAIAAALALAVTVVAVGLALQ